MPRGQARTKGASGRAANGAAPVAVLAKAVAVLDHVAAEGEVTPARLAELTGEPRSTVYRLLASLQELDLVEPGRRRGTYLLGVKLFRLGGGGAPGSRARLGGARNPPPPPRGGGPAPVLLGGGCGALGVRAPPPA